MVLSLGRRCDDYPTISRINFHHLCIRDNKAEPLRLCFIYTYSVITLLFVLPD